MSAVRARHHPPRGRRRSPARGPSGEGGRHRLRPEAPPKSWSRPTSLKKGCA